MHIAAPFLLIAGGVLLGLLFHAFSRHRLLGFLTLALALTLIGIGLSGSSLTLPGGVQINQPSPPASHSPSPSHT